MGYRKQVKHRIRRASHGDIQRHGIQESLTGGDAAGQHAFVPFLVILIGILYNQFGGISKQLLTVSVGSYNRAVARKRQPYRFVQAVHGIGGEHARATSARGAGVLLYFGNIPVAHSLVRRFNHGID